MNWYKLGIREAHGHLSSDEWQNCYEAWREETEDVDDDDDGNGSDRRLLPPTKMICIQCYSFPFVECLKQYGSFGVNAHRGVRGFTGVFLCDGIDSFDCNCHSVSGVLKG